ncbi:proteophosphoglycan related protein [Cyclospora cayetanensis]|uniref:Proteophosphoglycan related protein n=1 Tax=Cyclospora cayetanensis TaxID=88456 RepID=A0A1D3CXG5_9EIME|nr:proteophosphoglycan related protein [Cyclospora cayetanensis]
MFAPHGDQSITNLHEAASRGHSASGRDSPLSLSELPMANAHTGSRRPLDASSAHRGSNGSPIEQPHGYAGSVHSEWPRGRPRNAVSRVGYINDEREPPVGARSKDSMPLTPESGMEACGVALPPSATGSQLVTPREPKSGRPPPRLRMHQMHLAVPTTT